MAVIDETYVTAEGRKNVLTYKYKPQDESLISPLLQPYWEYCVTLLPITLAPNAVTLIGFVTIIYHYFQTIYFLPFLQGDAPRWIFIVNALAIWWYQTLDAIDGKQARRTKSGSPLGELFDHGCDSLASMLQTVALAGALQLGGSIYCYFMVMAVHTIFYFSIWEQYYTDVLRFSIIAGPTEALLGVIGIHLITGVLGVGFWRVQLLFGIQLGQIVAFVFLFMLIPALRENIQYVMKSQHTPEDLALKGGALRVLSPYFIILVFWNVWMFGGSVNLFAKYTVLACSIFGLVMGFCITRLVICRVCHQRAGTNYAMLYPLPLLALHSLNTRFLIVPIHIPDMALFILYLAFVIVCYSHMIYNVIDILCQVLKIQCFTIKDIRLEQPSTTEQK